MGMAQTSGFMMTMKKTSHYKPDLLVLLAFFVGFGVLATSAVHAAEPLNIMSFQDPSARKKQSDRWYQSLWGVDLAGKLSNWKPKVTVDQNGEGLDLSRPFGVRGPALRLSDSMPDAVTRSLRAGGDSQIGAFDDTPDVYLFLEKRW